MHEDFRKCTDEEIWEDISKRAAHYDPRDQKYVSLGMTELSLRSEKATREAIRQLDSGIEAFKESNDRHSQRVVGLTWALVFLSFVLVLLTIVLALPVARDLLRPDRAQTGEPASRPLTQSLSDPLTLYGPYNAALVGCLKTVNRDDPLGLFASDPNQAKQRKSCFERYAQTDSRSGQPH